MTAVDWGLSSQPSVPNHSRGDVRHLDSPAGASGASGTSGLSPYGLSTDTRQLNTINTRVPTSSSLLPNSILPLASDALERQPQLASGYEWNERFNTSGRANDGTASLSLEPDGQGYLGKCFRKGSCGKNRTDEHGGCTPLLKLTFPQALRLESLCSVFCSFVQAPSLCLSSMDPTMRGNSSQCA